MHRPTTEQLVELAVIALQAAALATHNPGLDAIALAVHTLQIATTPAPNTNSRPHHDAAVAEHDTSTDSAGTEQQPPHDDDPGT